MRRAGCAEVRGKGGAAKMAGLLRMNTEFESKSAGASENRARFSGAESERIAKYIAIFGEIAFLYRREHLRDNAPHIYIAFAFIFTRYGMRSEKCRNDILGLRTAQAPNHPKNFKLIAKGQAIPALNLDCCRPPP